MAKKRVSLTLSEDLVEFIDSEASQQDLNRSQMIEKSLKNYFDVESVSKAVILCGDSESKSLQKYKDNEVICHVLNHLKEQEVSEVYLLAGQNEEKVRKALSENFGDLEINYVPEEDSKGNAAALANLETRISEPFVVVNGHVLADVDISEMFDMHRNNSSVATIALTAVQDPSKYGAARLKGDKILGFEEKPEKGGEPSKLINAGTYIFDPEIFDYLSSDSIETVFEKLAEEGELSGYIYGGKWIDVSS